MSHLPIKPVDHYLDQIKSKHVLFVGGITVIILVIFGPTLSDLLFSNRIPATATKGGYFSDHYPDGVMRYPTLSGGELSTPRLFSSEPYVIPPYQGDWLQGGSIQ